MADETKPPQLVPVSVKDEPIPNQKRLLIIDKTLDVFIGKHYESHKNFMAENGVQLNIDSISHWYKELPIEDNKEPFKSAEEILSKHTIEHFALSSNIYAAKNDILRAMHEFRNQPQKPLEDKEVDEKLYNILNEFYENHECTIEDIVKNIKNIIKQ